MPSARTHDVITIISGAALLPLAWTLTTDLSITLSLSGAHLLSGLLFSCDLDIDSTEYRRWGPLRLLWWPYKEMIPHRSWLSHGLIIGPLLRLAYFALIAGGLAWLVLTLLDRGELWQRWGTALGDWLRAHPEEVYAALIGFVLGGAAHSIPDWLSTGAKRAWNGWTRL
ncbi:metal-binding protein [Kallotenue papyrolyticum]|uniref:metal-binding protein n=1 Tax=Kallotenue papyrolyticum TaxID=1325125 RepID=UPI000471613B|nr:metal-binding protein [Kallotenue papyrolyticum]